jgi:archaellum biogenesis protein FlaJ (TadC family)
MKTFKNIVLIHIILLITVSFANAATTAVANEGLDGFLLFFAAIVLMLFAIYALAKAVESLADSFRERIQ